MATVLTNVGRAIIAGFLSGDVSSASTVFNRVGWGTGTGTAAVADTALFSEASEARATGTRSRVTTNVANDTFQVTGTLVAAADKTITNAGALDAATGGNLLIHYDHPALPLMAGEQVTYTFKLTPL